MLVEVWSDIVCPWCYIGKRRLEQALEMFPEREAVTVRYRSFELDPNRARSTDETLDRMLASKYGVPLEQARAMNTRVTAIAATEGIAFRLEVARPGNTFDAHRLTHLARGSGLEAAAVERFQAAYFTEGAAIGDREVLVALSAEVGMDPDAARATLAGDQFADSVREDEGLAAHLGIRGVPFFVLDRRLGVSGAQDAGVLLGALEQARRDAGTSEVASAD
jgi:predicted DsbA family dithiol-disulfide isomerase